MTLEITEDAVTGRGIERVAGTLDALAGLGFTLSLDDFGTGHASLEHLHALPIGEMKIAKQFVDEVTHDRRDQAIARSALALCDRLDIACVVEGVETRAQAATLADLGAHIGQGFLWHRPDDPGVLIEAVNTAAPRSRFHAGTRTARSRPAPGGVEASDHPTGV